MDHTDRTAIEGLFDKVAQAAQSQPQRDPAAEALIADRIAATPGAAYYLAQTVIMQEQALATAEVQLQRAQQTQQQSGGLFGGLFGGGQQPAPRQTASQPAPPQPAAQPAPRPGPWGGARRGGGGGFLAGAAQTAMGVAGGVLLGQAIGGMFAGPADAAGFDDTAEAGADEPGFDEGGFDDGGFDGGFE